jgi:hypothetical protein
MSLAQKQRIERLALTDAVNYWVGRRGDNDLGTNHCYEHFGTAERGH